MIQWRYDVGSDVIQLFLLCCQLLQCGGIFVLFFGGGQVDVDLGVGDYVFVFIVQFVVIGSGYVEGFNEYMLDFWVD